MFAAVRDILNGTRPPPTPGEARDFCRDWRRGGVALVVLCLAVYLPGLLAMPPIDRDEARFAQASRQMLEAATLPADQLKPEFHDGGWVIPKIQANPRLNKPPLIYWLQSAAVYVLTLGDVTQDAIWMYRVPSMLAAIISVLAIWRLGLGMFEPRAAWVGAAFLAVSPMVVWEAHQSRADQLLLTTVCLAQLGLWRVWKARHDKHLDVRTAWLMPVLFWAATGLGILTKGITPVFSLLTILGVCIVNREWRWVWRLKPWMGLPIVIAVVGPWVVGVIEKIGWEKYSGIVFDEVGKRGTEPKEGHWGPPGYHTLLVGVFLWPGCMFLVPAIIRAWRRGRSFFSEDGRQKIIHGRQQGRDAELFLLAWAVPAWVLFELYMTKLPHYTLPMYPALALLAARTLFAASHGVPGTGRMWLKWGLHAWAGVGALWVTIGVVVSGLAMFNVGPLMALALLAGPALLVRQMWKALDKGKHMLSAALAMGVVVATLAITLQLAIPSFASLPSRVSRLVAMTDPKGLRPIASVDYHEDSMIFLTRGRVERITSANLENWLVQHPKGIVILPDELRGAHPTLESVSGVDVKITGWNYSKGRFERLTITEQKPR